MYANKVIESLDRAGLVTENSEKQEIILIMKNINDSVKFELGCADLFIDINEKKITSDLFIDKEMNLTFSSCWFDWEYSKETKEKYPNTMWSTKKGCSIFKVKNTIKDDVWIAVTFFYDDDSKKWMSTLFWHLISPRMYWAENKNFDIMFNMFGINNDENKFNSKKSTCFAVPSKTASLMFNNNKETLKTALDKDITELIVVEDILKLFTCKNITTKTTPAPEKLNKKRIKKGKLPIFEYKTLHITLPGKTKKNGLRKSIGTTQRLHMCRGHFKEYTEDAPLFGRITGRFWWQPAVRGDKSKGEIKKDYTVKTRS
ncbi:MAG: hypothetical protein WC124_10730 [Desulfoplanes sp.]